MANGMECSLCSISDDFDSKMSIHLRIFQLSPEVSHYVCQRMKTFCEEHLFSSVFRVEYPKTPPGASEIERVVLEIDRQIKKWKDALFLERLLLEVGLADPAAFHRGSAPES